MWLGGCRRTEKRTEDVGRGDEKKEGVEQERKEGQEKHKRKCAGEKEGG